MKKSINNNNYSVSALIQNEYVKGNLTYRQLSEKFNVPLNIISQIGKKENWVEKKKQYKSKLLCGSQAENVSADKLEDLKKCCNTLTLRLSELLGDENQFNRYIVSEKDGPETFYTEKIFKKCDDKSIKNIVSVLKDLTEIKRNLYDIQTITEKQSYSLNSKKLNLSEAMKTAPESVSGVILLPQSDWSENE